MIRILYADDDPEMRTLVKMFLESVYSEISVTLVNGASEALEAIQESEYDLIVSDYNMPGGADGLQFLKILRSNEYKTPFILYTAETGNIEFVQRALREGASFVHAKGEDAFMGYVSLVCKICWAIHRNRSNDRLVGYKLTQYDFSDEFKKHMEETVSTVKKSLKSDGVLMILFANEDDILFSSNVIGISDDKIRNLLTPNCVEVEDGLVFDSLINASIEVDKIILGKIYAFNGNKQFNDKDKEKLRILSIFVASKIMEWVSRPK